MTATPTGRRAWVIAARPQTLPAGAAPVVVGVGLAVADGVFAPVPALAALVGALLIQVGTNFANDYYDAVKGADTDDSEGFTRVTAGGLIEPTRVRRATVVTFGLAVLVGLYLVAIGGLPILVIGLASIAAGVLYTGGPYPYGYHGLGDLFVFVFFGLVAVAGSYYVQAVRAAAETGRLVVWVPSGTVTADAVLAGAAVGALATGILVVNNLRDRETDRRVGKRTLAVILGYRLSRVEYLALLGFAYAVPPLFWARGYEPFVLAPLATAPLAARVARTVLTRTDGDALNPALERTGQLLALYALLFALGLALPEVV